MLKQLKYFVFALALMSSTVFFSINALMGIQYVGTGQSNGYKYFCIVIFLLVSIYSFYDIKKIHYRIAILIPIVLSFFFFIEYPTAANSEQSELMIQSFSAFWAFSVSCILVGIDMGNTKDITRVFKWIDLLALLVIVACLKALPSMLLSRFVVFGGSNYQLYSYSAAFSSSILLYNILNDNQCRFVFLHAKIYSFITIFLIMGGVACIMASGGRGGFLLLMVNVTVLCFLRRKWIIRNSLWVIILIPLVLIVLSFINVAQINSIMENGSERITQTFFSSEGGSSVSRAGRGEVFDIAYKMIDDNPFGYGFFRAYAIAGIYPHNIFLEILLNGGYALLMAFICFIYYIGKKINKMIARNKVLTFVLILASYPIIMLLATSTYLWTGLFWFVISFVITWRLDASPITKR